MENKKIRELIIQKKESYQQIIDETKKANVDKTVITGISLAALVAGFGGIIAPVSSFTFVASLVAAGAGGYGFFMNVPNYFKNLVVRYKSRFAKRKLNKALKVIDSLEKEENKTKTKKK